MTDYFQIITNEWIDYVIVKKNNVVRESNNDNGTYFIENNVLKINWNNWGEELFEKINDIYYNISHDNFEIFLENNEWNDIGIFNKLNNKIIRKSFPSEEGIFMFDKNILIINWKNWGLEKFYQQYYGKYYKNTTFSNLIKNNIKKDIKILAIVFPQFHEIPENNNFWGTGFTEWTLLKNVPRIINGEIIKQPHNDIGYFNLKDYEHRKYMRILADKYNISGFCYYHYWFHNKKVMYEPTELMLQDNEPNKPFLFCWANEQWTKRWDGGNNEILIEQKYSDEDGNKDHFKYLLQFFKHKNYIKRFNKPIFIFYRIEEKDLRDIKNIIILWNKLALEEGFDGIHFMRFLGPFNNEIKLEEIEGFVNFCPGYFTQKYFHELYLEDNEKIFDDFNGLFNEEVYLEKNIDIKQIVKNKIISSGYDHYKIINDKEKQFRTSKFFIYDGKELYKKILDENKEYDEQHRGISLNWNNTPRRNYNNKEYSKYPHYYKNINPDLFGDTMYSLLEKVNNTPNKNDDFIFISAWNEWNEQAMLEPNVEDGYDYLIKLSKSYNKFYNYPKKGKILIISHMGGGTEKYINDLKEIYYDYEFIDFDNYTINKNYDDIYKECILIHINSILFNNLKYNYDIFFNKYLKNITKYITIHDYQWLYPNNPNITQDNFLSITPDKEDLIKFDNLLSICNKIIFPSHNIFNNYNFYINLDKYKEKINIIYHCDKIINHDFLNIPNITDNTINICYLGYFINYKGSNIFKKLSYENKFYKDYKIIYHVFGNISQNEENINYDNIIFHDTYKDCEIINKLQDHNIHGITHLSLFEESYCYALTNSINSGIPILYIKRGSLTERLIEKNKYFSCDIHNINNIYKELLDFIIINKNIKNYYHINNNIQPNRWYLENYVL